MALLVSILVSGLVPPAPAQAAGEIVPVGADGTIRLDGLGWGHGVGMSQYGALGGANAGANAKAIAAAYFPGTVLSAAPSQPVRVLLSRWDGLSSCTSQPPGADPCGQVAFEAGLVMTNVASGAQVAVPSTIAGRAVTAVGVGAGSVGLTLWARAGTWQPLASGVQLTGPIDITAPDGTVSVRVGSGDHAYRGALRIVRASATTIQRINVVPLEDYLLGVVPEEMPASWPASAVQAQGVAARTYAAAAMHSAGSRAYDLCDTTSCQVYGGVGSEQPAATTKLRSATPADVRGQILTSGGTPVTAFFSSSNGGFTVSGGASYLPAKADGWDPQSAWTRTVSGSCLAAKYPGRGSLTQLVVLARDGNGSFGGRVTSLRLDFTGGSVTIGSGSSPMSSDAAIRGSMSGCGDSGGLKSSLWRASSTAPPTGPGVLSPGQSVASGASFVSATGQFRVTVDASGPGLVLRSRTCPDVTLAKTSAGPSTLVMQGDGNLVLYGPSGDTWSSGTWGHPGAYAVMQGDANLVVYGLNGVPLWGSGTSCQAAMSYEDPSGYVKTSAPNQAVLQPGDSMFSLDRSTMLAMQTDGNLVLYKSSKALWATGTYGNPGAFAVLQWDGNLVVYGSGRAVFASGTWSPASAAGVTGETRLAVDPGRIGIVRTLRDRNSGAVVSATTQWVKP